MLPFVFVRDSDSNLHPDFVVGSLQERLYNTAAKPIVDNVLKGMNCCMFAYGQTGTGTYPNGLNDRDPLNVGCTNLFRSHLNLFSITLLRSHLGQIRKQDFHSNHVVGFRI